MNDKLKLFLILTGCIIFVATTLLFAFPLRDQFLKLVVTPIIESFMVLRWYIHRLPQLFLWITFVIIGAIVVIGLLRKSFPLPKRTSKPQYQSSTCDAISDLKRLSLLIAHTYYRPFSRRKIAAELVPLCVRLIAHRERLKLQQARERFESFQWCDNESVRSFFDYRHQYSTLGKGKNFKNQLNDVIASLEQYYQGE
jgi:hypothetical protein